MKKLKKIAIKPIKSMKNALKFKIIDFWINKIKI
jgi:hypothetical protein